MTNSGDGDSTTQTAVCNLAVPSHDAHKKNRGCSRCKPLQSTSALKHRGVAIIFNHDYDRIIFRSEIVNLISHDCHSYSHITLANGIPPRTAMVMAGENVAIDVDEEVYGNDGTGRHEAQEASAGGRRAIADADQAGQLHISDEAKTARTLRTPEPPRDAAKMAHNATHVPFSGWCPFCVASRGRSSPHRRVVVNKTADTLPKFQTDHMFTGQRAKLSHASHSWKRAVVWTKR